MAIDDSDVDRFLRSFKMIGSGAGLSYPTQKSNHGFQSLAKMGFELMRYYQ